MALFTHATTRIDLPTDRSFFSNNAANYFLQHSQDFWGGRLVTLIQSDDKSFFSPQEVQAKAYGWIFTALKICVILFTTPIGLFFRWASLGNGDVQEALKSTSIIMNKAEEVLPPNSGSDCKAPPLSKAEAHDSAIPLTQAEEAPSPNHMTDHLETSPPPQTSLPPLTKDATAKTTAPFKLEIPKNLLSLTGMDYFDDLFKLYYTPNSTFIKILADPNSLLQLDDNDQETQRCWEHHATQIIDFEWAILTGKQQPPSDVNYRTFFNVMQLAYGIKLIVKDEEYKIFLAKDFLQQLKDSRDLRTIIDSEAMFKQKIIRIFTLQYELQGYPEHQEFITLIKTALGNLEKLNSSYKFPSAGINSHRNLFIERSIFLEQSNFATVLNSPIDRFIHFMMTGTMQPSVFAKNFPELSSPSSALVSNATNGASSKLGNLLLSLSTPEKNSIPAKLTESKGRSYFERLLKLNQDEKFKPFIKQLQVSQLILELFNPPYYDQKMFERLKHHYQQCISCVWEMVLEPQDSLSKEKEELNFFIIICWMAATGVHSLENSNASVTYAKTTFQSFDPLPTAPKEYRSPKKSVEKGVSFLKSILYKKDKELNIFIENNKDQFMGLMLEICSARAATKNAWIPHNGQLLDKAITEIYDLVLQRLTKAKLQKFCPTDEMWKHFFSRMEEVIKFFAPKKIKVVSNNTAEVQASFLN